MIKFWVKKIKPTIIWNQRSSTFVKAGPDRISFASGVDLLTSAAVQQPRWGSCSTTAHLCRLRSSKAIIRFDSFSDAHERIYARTHGALTRHVRGESPAEQKLPVSCVTERRLSLMPTQLYAARSPIASPITLLSISVLLPAGCCFFHPLRIAASLEACLCLSLLGDVGPPQPDAGFCPDITGRGGIHGGE